MKLFSMLLVLTVIVSSGCDKSAATSASLDGTWRLVQIRGMMVINEFSPETRESLKLNGDTYELRVGETVTSGTFETQADPTVKKETCLEIQPRLYERRITFAERNSDQKIFYQLDGDTLKFISGCFAYDGGSEKIYTRGVTE